MRNFFAQSLGRVILLLFLLTPVACTEAKLEKIPPEPVYRDDKLEVFGSLCTREPETLTFPLRVLFVVDASVSMEATDPPDPVTGLTSREQAVMDTWTRLLDQGPEGVRVGVLRFSAEAQSRTPIDLDGDGLADTYYTADRTLLTAATRSLGVTDRTTNFSNALGEAYFEMRTEFIAADLESLPLSKYVIIFLSDGIPDTDDTDSRGNAEDEILESVDALNELAKTFRVGGFSFHTAYISGGDGSAGDRIAQDLLQKMAKRGNGSFRSFASGEEINFLFVDFSVLKRVFTMKSLIAVNLNVIQDLRQVPDVDELLASLNLGAELEDEDVAAVDVAEDDADAAEEVELTPLTLDSLDDDIVLVNPMSFGDLNGSSVAECGEPMVDSDGDGLSDLIEVKIGSHALVRDTDDDGLNDLLEWEFMNSGLAPLVVNKACYTPNPCIDADTDGFCDCSLDTNADGACDCASDPEAPCLDDFGHDCLDADLDGWCDCPDRNADGLCDYKDGDGDGLHDCEEVFFGTAQNGNDTDADGLPDMIEVRFQTNPTVVDNMDDADFDRTDNGVEVMGNTNPQCDDASLRSRIAYRYDLADLGLKGSSSCYDYHVSNITLVPTLYADQDVNEYPGNGWNRVLVFAGEVAFDDPTSFASYRVACVMARYNPAHGYKVPASGRIKLLEEDFVEVPTFDPKMHCKVR